MFCWSIYVLWGVSIDESMVIILFRLSCLVLMLLLCSCLDWLLVNSVMRLVASLVGGDKVRS